VTILGIERLQDEASGLHPVEDALF
jgi:hypothetical protein